MILINKEALWKDVISSIEHCEDFLEIIDRQKDVDAVEVVRCKDCKYWRDDHTCREHSLVSPMGANDFCSRGAKDGDSE